MSIQVVFPAAPEHRRPGANTWVIGGAANAAAARTAAEVLAGAQVGSFTSTTHTVVALTDASGESFSASIAGPVGAAFPIKAPGA